MRMRPNPTSGVPVYLQLAEQFKREIAAGALKPGEALPPVPDVATALVINPNAVERAYRTLAREGVVDLRRESCATRAIARQYVRPALPHRSPSDHDRELAAARDVQQRLLPQQHPPVAGIEYAGFCQPAHAVGGDYYDFICRSDRELTIAIADVCGKGVSAALLMATLRAFLHGETRRSGSSPAATVQTLNQLVCESFASNRFASFFYGHFDAATRTLRYVNAGHPPPVVLGEGGGEGALVRLRQGGPVLGLLPDCTYEEGCLTLATGDLFIAFTDGVTEAFNEAGEEWGEDGLLDVARRAPSAVHEVIDGIVRGVEAYSGSARQHDDMTLLVIRVGHQPADAIPA